MESTTPTAPATDQRVRADHLAGGQQVRLGNTWTTVAAVTGIAANGNHVRVTWASGQTSLFDPRFHLTIRGYDGPPAAPLTYAPLPGTVTQTFGFGPRR